MKSSFLVPGERKPSQFSVNSTRFNTDTFCGSLRVRIHGVRMYPGGTPIHYLYGYVPPNGVVILKLLIWNGVSISEAFCRTGYKNLWITALSSA